MKLTTYTLSIGELRSSNSTSRNHSQAQIKKAKHLFAKQGIIVPIIVDEDHHIIDGHLRIWRVLNCLALIRVSDSLLSLRVACTGAPRSNRWLGQ